MIGIKMKSWVNVIKTIIKVFVIALSVNACAEAQCLTSTFNQISKPKNAKIVITTTITLKNTCSTNEDLSNYRVQFVSQSIENQSMSLSTFTGSLGGVSYQGSNTVSQGNMLTTKFSEPGSSTAPLNPGASIIL